MKDDEKMEGWRRSSRQPEAQPRKLQTLRMGDPQFLEKWVTYHGGCHCGVTLQPCAALAAYRKITANLRSSHRAR